MWVSSAQGAPGHFAAVISYMPRTLWQVLLVLLFVFICMNHFPTDFPPFILIQSSRRLDSLCWIKMLPFEEDRRVQYTAKDPNVYIRLYQFKAYRENRNYCQEPWSWLLFSSQQS